MPLRVTMLREDEEGLSNESYDRLSLMGFYDIEEEVIEEEPVDPRPRTPKPKRKSS